MTTLSNQRATAAALIAGYNAWDIDQILAPRAPDCVQQVLPASLKREPRTNEEYRRFHEEKIGSLFKNFKVHRPSTLILTQRISSPTVRSD